MNQTVRVDLGARSYPIEIGPGLIDRIGPRIASVHSTDRAIVVTDATVGPLYGRRVVDSLAASGSRADMLAVPAGEASKSWETLGDLLDRILALDIDRKTPIIALGGGVVGDLAGFAAASVLRGVPLVQVPTTLLAQVDSAVGGKTGINSRYGKNLIGAFHQPSLVLADTDSLSTLPMRQRRAGYAEVVKYGLIDRPDLFAWLEEAGDRVLAGDADAVTWAIGESVRAKAAIVAADERESGQRALLNLGHTFGHALEAEAGYGDTLLHGEAVAIGMVMAFDLSVRLGLCPPDDAERVRRHLAGRGLPTRPPVGLDWTSRRLLSHMAKDKKAQAGRVTFILVRGIGRAFVSKAVDPAMVIEFLDDSRAVAA